MDFVFNIALVGLVSAVLYLALQPRFVFAVRVKHGLARVNKGKVTAAFLEEIDLICREAGVTHGKIGGVRRGKRIVLVFSSNLPEPCQQRLRNMWVLHG